MKRFFRWSAVLIVLSSGTATLLCYLANYSFLFNTIVHFRVQYAIGAIVSLIIFSFLRNKTGVLIAGLLVVANLWSVVPLYLSVSEDKAEENERATSLLLMNVLSSNYNTEAVVGEINRLQPDIIVLEEITPRWFGVLSGLAARYPYQVHEVREDNFGIWVLSKRALADERIVHWGTGQLPTITFRCPIAESFLEVVALHPMSPGSPRGMHWRNEQLQAVVRHYAGYSHPLLIIGDLNTTSFAPIFSELTRWLNLKDSRRGFGLQPSWPAVLVSPLMITLDHVLVSAGVQVIDRKTGNDIGSDHLPVYVEVTF